MSKKILLADDSITIQKVISITFASEDYELNIVGDGESAIKKASEIRPDLVIADIAMPGKSGYEVCSFIKSNPELQKTPVLLLAGTFEPLNKDEAVRAGADDSIVKPFESQELLDRVRELLSRNAEAVPAGRAPDTKGADGSDLWEAGDFLSIPEEFETKKPEAVREHSADLDFLSSGALFEEEPAKPLSGDSDFTDLVMDEDFKAPESKEKEPFDPFGSFDAGHSFDLGSDPVKGEPRPLEIFEQARGEEPRAAAFEMEPFDIEPFKAEPAALDDFGKHEWDLPSAPAAEEKEPEQFAEPDLLEIPEEAIERAEAVSFSSTVEAASFERPFTDAPVPLREVMASVPPAAEPVSRISEDDVRKAVDKAAESIEARLAEDLNLRLSKAEARVNEAIERVAAKMEERLRGELSAKLGKAEVQASQAVERVAAKVEERLRNELTARLEKSLAIPREQLETLVKRASKDVVEHVAWEVLPEMAERLIKTEINRVKEALVRLK